MDIRAIGMGLAFALMWSSAFTSARIIVADASPLFALALRFLISGLRGGDRDAEKAGSPPAVWNAPPFSSATIPA